MTLTNSADPASSDPSDAEPNDSDADLALVRSLLTHNERVELEALRTRVDDLEALVVDLADRATAVGEVLVEAVDASDTPADELGHALRPALENAVSLSARNDSTVLAEALYPVLGPAMRKMIANLFTADGGGRSFRVDQVLLIERGSGVLLAATSGDGESLNDADIVSGMLDAIRMFVQDAFETPDHDGLQDLRVGDTSVLVEWGPNAVLASVIHGIATDGYRENAATTLEAIHADYQTEFDAFNGNLAPFEQLTPTLADLHSAGSAGSQRGRSILLAAVLGVVVALVILALVAWL